MFLILDHDTLHSSRFEFLGRVKFLLNAVLSLSCQHKTSLQSKQTHQLSFLQKESEKSDSERLVDLDLMDLEKLEDESDILQKTEKKEEIRFFSLILSKEK